MTPADPEQDRFAEDFGQVFAAIRQARSACPLGERLAEWVADMPDASAATQVRDHVAMCGRCDSLATRMRAVRQKLGREPWWRFLGKPAVGWAAAFLVLVATASYLGTTAQPISPAAPPAARGIEVAQFVPLREAQRGVAGTGPAPIPGTTRMLVLAFVIPAQPGHRYTVRVQPGPDEPRELSVSPATGDAYLTIDHRQFPSGQYACVVTETDTAGAPTGRVFTFPFTL